MARLTKTEIIDIALKKKLKIINPDEYLNLTTELQFECEKGHKFISTMDMVRNEHFSGCPVCQQQYVEYASKPPKKNGFRIIGFDQATKHFGISVFDDQKLVYYDCIDFVDTNTEIRLMQISKFIDNVCKMWEPDFVMFEDIQLQGGNAGFKTFKVLAELLGIVIAVLNINNIKHDLVSNKVWQSQYMIMGKDRATQKHNVIEKVKLLFGIEVSDDVADAILIGKYAVDKKRTAEAALNRQEYLF